MSSEALKNEFLLESFENLSNIDQELTQLEKDPADKELINSIYRTVHTMKGSSGFLGLSKLQDVTHNAENLLDGIREQKIDVNDKIIDLLLKTFDVCNFILKNIESSNNEGDIDVEPLKRVLQRALKNELVVGKKNNSVPASEKSSEKSSEKIDDLNNLIELHQSTGGQMVQGIEEPQSVSSENEESEISAAALESLKELAAAGDLDPALLAELEAGNTEETSSTPVSSGDSESDTESNSEVEKNNEESDQRSVEENLKKLSVQENQLKEKKSKENNKSSISDSVVRVNVSVLDKIMNTVGELVLNRNQFLQTSGRGKDSEIARLSNQLDIITSELQSEVMSTRMQPIGNILTKFERLVRDLAKENNKKITLKLSGQDTELDRTLIEAIKDPLVHIVRNSADHGIEDVSTREAKGKSPEGIIHIKAYNESGQVTIEISDNGKGLDKEKILNKAVEKGLVSTDQIASLSETQIFSLIFNPGFSTAEKVTNLSGRGVGMDVVKTNIEKIGGTVSLNSKIGEGTTFKLRIPLTLAIVPALIVKSNSQEFAIPQLNLVELVRLEGEKDLKSIEEIQGAKLFRLRGKLTPLFSLTECLDLKKTEKINTIINRKDLHDESSLANDDDSKNIVILNSENNVFGIEVEEILDTQEIVVKPLNSSLKDLGVFG